MKQIPVLLLLILLSLSGCASPPRQELQSARMALTQAQHAGAEFLAPEAYREAAEALIQGEALVREKDYESARRILPQAETYARKALSRAQEERERLEREKARAAAPLPSSPPPARKPVRRPPPPDTATASPAKSKPAADPPARTLPTRYTVGENENLRSIAAREEIYGDALLWPLLYQANRDQIRDPRRLYPGQIITIPRGLPSDELEEIRERARRSGLFAADGQRPSPTLKTP